MIRLVLPVKSAVVLVPALLALPHPLPSQERPPVTLEQIEELLAARLAPGVILRMAGADCLAFRVDEDAERRLRAAGANAELVAGLREACYRGPEPERQAVSETPRPTAPAASSVRFDPGSAALRSLAVPGLGQFYTGRRVVGGLFLVAGILYRTSAGLLVITMLVATLMVMDTSGGDLTEFGYPMVVGLVLLGLLFTGPGKFAISKE